MGDFIANVLFLPSEFVLNSNFGTRFIPSSCQQAWLVGPESSPSGLIRLPAPKALLVSASGTAENQTGAIGISVRKHFVIFCCAVLRNV